MLCVFYGQEGALLQVVPPHTHQAVQRSILTIPNLPQSAISAMCNMVTINVQDKYILGFAMFLFCLYSYYIYLHFIASSYLHFINLSIFILLKSFYSIYYVMYAAAGTMQFPH